MSTIKARFKAANVKDSGSATLQFDVSTKAEGFIDAVEMIGEKVDLTVELEQKALPLVYEYETEEAGTGRDTDPEEYDRYYDVVEDEHGLPEGGDGDGDE